MLGCLHCKATGQGPIWPARDAVPQAAELQSAPRNPECEGGEGEIPGTLHKTSSYS